MRHKVLEVLITRIAPIATLVDAAGDHGAISLVAGNDVPDMCLVMRYVCSYVANHVLVCEPHMRYDLWPISC